MTEIELVDDDFEYEPDVSGAAAGEEPAGADMFEGDSGTLHPEQRKCLIALLKHRYISAERHPDHWEVLLRDEGLIKSRLNDLFLELQVERDQQIAFKRQAVSYSRDPLPSLLRERAHTKEETIVMMALRQRYFAQRQEGEDVVYVNRETLHEEIEERWPEDLTNRAAAQKRAGTAIDGLATAGVLLKTPDPDRFRISPIIEVLLPIEKLRELWTWLMTQNGTTPDEDVEVDDELPLDEIDLNEEDV